MTPAQNFFHDLRDGHVLINGILVRTVEQRQAWPERQGVTGFVPGGAETFKAAHHALNHPHGLLHSDAVALVNRGLQRQGGGLHQHHLLADDVVRAGELNAVAEGKAQGLVAFKGQYIEFCFTSLHRQLVVVVAESDWEITAHACTPCVGPNASPIPSSSLQLRHSDCGFCFAAMWVSNC
ncbi:hypothetical protein NB725_002286 [Pantoea ananatis]|nr:hypothetical protein [Pantoea ananatis]MCW0339605.1 hypothetical protein [Pantoea ananatis]MCW0358053.1 hypothetical protein [Pantoea ananatis]MCW0362676.1 hypothetical protein [Pantoea ananatis]